MGCCTTPPLTAGFCISRFNFDLILFRGPLGVPQTGEASIVPTGNIIVHLLPPAESLNDDSGFIESDEDEDASFYNYDISPSVISDRNGSTSDQQDQQLVVENNYMTNFRAIYLLMLN